VFMVLGGGLAAFDRRYRQATARSKPSTAVVAVGVQA